MQNHTVAARLCTGADVQAMSVEAVCEPIHTESRPVRTEETRVACVYLVVSEHSMGSIDSGVHRAAGNRCA